MLAIITLTVNAKGLEGGDGRAFSSASVFTVTVILPGESSSRAALKGLLFVVFRGLKNRNLGFVPALSKVRSTVATIRRPGTAFLVSVAEKIGGGGPLDCADVAEAANPIAIGSVKAAAHTARKRFSPTRACPPSPAVSS